MTIIPNKYTTLDKSLIGIAGIILKILIDNEVYSVTSIYLWSKVQEKSSKNELVKIDYQIYTQALIILYMFDIIGYDMEGNIIAKN